MKWSSRFAIGNGLWGGCFDRMKMIREKKNGGKGSEKTKMGTLNVDKTEMGAEDARLIGALIGLARATDGNTVRTEETGRLMRAGLAALRHGKGSLSERTAGKTDSGIALIEKIHAEKRILAPDCATCGAPCGKTADYDINQWKKETEAVREQKWLLLERLVEVACGDSAEINSFLPKSLFSFGESWEAEWIAALVKEADNWITY